jgi:hypothetical protein
MPVGPCALTIASAVCALLKRGRASGAARSGCGPKVARSTARILGHFPCRCRRAKASGKARSGFLFTIGPGAYSAGVMARRTGLLAHGVALYTVKDHVAAVLAKRRRKSRAELAVPCSRASP